MATVVGAAQDRSVSIGRIFERAFATIRHNPGTALGLSLLFGAIPTMLVTYGMTVGMPADSEGTDSSTLFQTFSILLLFVGSSFVISALTQAVLTRATVMEAQGRVAGFGESMTAALKVLAPLLVLSIVYGLAVILGIIALIIPGVILAVMWSVSVPALVEERRGVFGSLARSRELTSGVRWTIVPTMILAAVLGWLIIGGEALFNLAVYGEADMTSQMPIGSMIVSAIANTLTCALGGTVQASLYVEVRDFKDGASAGHLQEIFA